MAGNVFHKRVMLGKEDAKHLLAEAIFRLVAQHGKAAVATQAGCSERTIGNALALDALPELHTVLNLLNMGPAVLNPLLAPFGYRLMPIDGEAPPHAAMLADTATLAATMAGALADGVVDHREEADIIAAARPVANRLAVAISAHDRKKAGLQ